MALDDYTNQCNLFNYSETGMRKSIDRETKVKYATETREFTLVFIEDVLCKPGVEMGGRRSVSFLFPVYVQ